MSIQEAALHGELVLYLRERLAERLARDGGEIEDALGWLDEMIRDWFFTPQRDLHGCAPRELIWAERRGEPNPVYPEHLGDLFTDDCPICQAESQRAGAALEAGEDPGWQWYYDAGDWPLIARYDPEGWEAFWVEEEGAFQEWRDEDTDQNGSESGFSVPTGYAPFPIEPAEASADEYVARLRRPWLDPTLHRAAEQLTERLDCPEPSVFGFRYRRISYDEAISLLVGLHEHGVDAEMLLAQIDLFPYQSVALDWLSRPEENVGLMIEAMEDEIPADDEVERARFRHHRDFILTLSQIIPPGARLWLQGWLEAVAHGVFTCDSREGIDDIL